MKFYLTHDHNHKYCYHMNSYFNNVDIFLIKLAKFRKMTLSIEYTTIFHSK